MEVQQAYNIWADQYDTNDNKTRDLEAIALKENLNSIHFERCLEMGCGTGKNTGWLASHAKEVTAIDFSEEMLAKAKTKIRNDNVAFQKADIHESWDFVIHKFNLICFSLVLEHIADLDPVFKQAANSLETGGYLYLGELHPFKQYSGTKARFDTGLGVQIVTCYNHHISDFIGSAKMYGLEIVNLREYFDDEDRNNIPRILAILFRKIV